MTTRDEHLDDLALASLINDSDLPRAVAARMLADLVDTLRQIESSAADAVAGLAARASALAEFVEPDTEGGDYRYGSPQ